MFMFRSVTIDSRDAFSRLDKRDSDSTGTMNFQAIQVEFLGSRALSLFISAIETGMIIVLLARFVVRRRERLAIRLLVYFATFLALYVVFELLLLCNSIF